MQKANPKAVALGGAATCRLHRFSLPFRAEMVKELFPPTFPAEYAKVMAQTRQQAAQIHQQAVQVGQAQQKAAQPAEQAALQQLQQQGAAATAGSQYGSADARDV